MYDTYKPFKSLRYKKIHFAFIYLYYIQIYFFSTIQALVEKLKEVSKI